MPRSISTRLLLAAMVLLLCGRPCWADLIEWDYMAGVFPSKIHATAFQPDPITSFPWFSGEVDVAFNGSMGNMVGSNNTTVGNWQLSGWVMIGAVATFAQEPVTVGLAFRDKESDQASLMYFQGQLNGTVTTFDSNLNLTFANPSRTLQLGRNTYHIRLSTVSGVVLPPPPWESSGPMHSWTGGQILLEVRASENPEPSTLVLVGIAGSLFGSVYCRWRRKTRDKCRGEPEA